MERKKKKKRLIAEKSKNNFGPRVADIFLGDSPGRASAIVHLPRVQRLSTQKSVYNTLPPRIESQAQSSDEIENEVNKINDGKALEELNAAFDTERLTYDDELIFRFSATAELPEKIEAKLIRNELAKLLDEDGQRENKLKTHIGKEKQIPREPAPENKPRIILSSDKVHKKTTLTATEKVFRNLTQKSSVLIGETKEPLKNILEKHAADECVSWVAPPVSWREYSSKERKKKPAEKKTIIVTSARGSVNPPKTKLRRHISKENIIESVKIAVVALSVGAAVGLIGAVSAAPRLMKSVEETAKSGAGHLVAGLKEIVGSNVEAGQKELDEAEKLFSAANDRLNSSMNIALRIMAKLDPKDRLRNGSMLLRVGKQLSVLGDDAAQLALLFKQPRELAGSLTDVLERSKPLMSNLADGLRVVDAEIKDLPLSQMPENLRADLRQLQTSIHALSQVTAGYLDSHDVLRILLGAQADRQYLFLFENNRELRPGGGFIGSFALTRVSKGEMKKIHVDSIYNPDGQLRDYLIPPLSLRKITDRWYARDGNWFADFRTNARKVATLFERSGGPTVDGVIAITPSVLEQLLRVTGPIAMPDYNLTIDAENVIDETQRLVTFDYDKETNAPKAFISDLLPEILNKVYALPQERWGDLANVFGDSLKQKQVILWLREQEAQAKVEKLGWGGVVADSAGDYLMRVEANIGGHKTDALIDQTVKYEVSLDQDGVATATLVTTRHHNGSKEGRLNWNPEEDWYRKTNVIYERTLVPKGSVLLTAQGFTGNAVVPTPFHNSADYSTYVEDSDVIELEKNSTIDSGGTVISEESGKTSFGNWIVTPPGETTVTVYRYRLPLKINLNSSGAAPYDYKLLVQSQPGHRPVQMEAALNIPSDLRFVWAGPEDGVTYSGRQKVSFTTIQKSDSVWGVVIEHP